MDIKGIQFEDISWDSARESIVFCAYIGKKKIPCAVGKTALNDYFQTKDTKAKAMENYQTHTKKIHNIVKRLIADDVFDDNNEVVIYTEDLI
jgi:hypothetical protein